MHKLFLLDSAFVDILLESIIMNADAINLPQKEVELSGNGWLAIISDPRLESILTTGNELISNPVVKVKKTSLNSSLKFFKGIVSKLASDKNLVEVCLSICEGFETYDGNSFGREIERSMLLDTKWLKNIENWSNV